MTQSAEGYFQLARPGILSSGKLPAAATLTAMEQRALKIIHNCLNTNSLMFAGKAGANLNQAPEL
jgi:hypothetical protein